GLRLPGDRHQALDQRPHRRAAPGEHPGQARDAGPHRAHPLRGTGRPHRAVRTARLASASVSFRRRRLVTAALTANALFPPRVFHTGVPSFVLGWLTSELAPHVLALTLT